MTPTLPASRAEAQARLALPPLNTAEFYAVVTAPAGTLVREGVAAPAFDQPGGGQQTELLDRIPADQFSEPRPMPE